MNTISIEKQRAITAYRAFLLGDTYPPLAPLELFLEVSNICNLRCAMCPTFSAVSRHRSFSVKEQQRGFFNINNCLASLETVLPHVLYVHAFGYGEPTIHPQFRELIEHLSKFRVMIDFITNGTQLTDELCDFLVKNNVAKVTVSFSGNNKTDYENIYIGGDFNKVLRGMDCLNKAKQKYGATYPALTVNSIAFRHHINHLPDFVDMMADYGVEKIEVKKLVENVDHLRGHAAPYRPEEELLLAEAKKRARQRGIYVDDDQYERESCRTDTAPPSTKLHDMKNVAKNAAATAIDSNHKEFEDIDLLSLNEAELNLELNLQPIKNFGEVNPYYCLEPFKTMYVRQNGYVKPCCFSPDKASALGNIHTNQAKEIWQGSPFTEIRKGIALGNYPKSHCKFCLRQGIGPKNNDIPRYLQNFIKWHATCFGEKLALSPTPNPEPSIEKKISLKPVPNIFTKLFSPFWSNPKEQDNICEISSEEIINTLKLKHPNDFTSGKVPIPLTIAKLKEIINRRCKAGKAVDDLVAGNLERLTCHEATGWLFLPHLPDFHGTMIVYHENDGQELARGYADKDRQDVQEAGHGNGSHGFHIPLPPRWDHEKSLTPHGLKVVVQELDLVLNDIFKSRECQISPKLWHNINQLFKLEKVDGVWHDNDNEWAWLSNESEFTLTALTEGTLTFNLIMPDEPMLQQILPTSIKVFADDKEIFNKLLDKSAYYEIRNKVSADQTIRYHISCDKFVVPNEYCGNLDTRKISVIMGHFGVL